MKRKVFPGARFAGVLSGLLALLVTTAQAEDRPRITRIDLEGTNVVVTARVPAGLRKLTLESRARLVAGAWVPRTVARLDGSGGDWIFRLPRTEPYEMLRVRADVSEPFPLAFYQGTQAFFGPPGIGADREGGLGPVDVIAGGAADTGTGRAVVESDEPGCHASFGNETIEDRDDIIGTDGAVHVDRQALAGERVDHVQHLQGTAIDGGVELEIERLGDEIRIRPARRSLEGVLKKFARFSPDFMPEGRGAQGQDERDPI